MGSKRGATLKRWGEFDVVSTYNSTRLRLRPDPDAGDLP